ncbi:MAG TPA: hypothetical protein EYP85_12490 [Armatimonadetes bacterium]|nr:hypothetical protein [Armatimonadota bacterium]
MRTISLMGLILLAAAASAAEFPLKVYAVQRVTTPPVVDGKLEDPVWREVPALSGFTYILGRAGEPADPQTSFRAVRDDRALYLAVECLEPAVKQLVTLKTVRDSPVFGDDSVEVFLDTNFDRRTYFQLVTNQRGTQYDARGMDPSWNAKWEAAGGVGEDRWWVEMAVPFRSLGVEPPAEGAVWGVNICRNRRAGPGEVYSAWATTPQGFHAPERFGLFVFGTLLDNLRQYYQHRRPAFLTRRNEIAALIREHPVAAQFQETLTGLQEEWTAIGHRLEERKSLAPEEWTAERGRLDGLFHRLEDLRWEVKFHILLNE